MSNTRIVLHTQATQKHKMSTTTKWAHLPNAVHIDRILASVKSHPDIWINSWNIKEPPEYKAAWNTALDVSLYQKSIRDAVWNEMWYRTRDEAYCAILCLIAYDECAHMIDSCVGELRILAAFGDQKAILMLPACIALNAIKEIA